MYDRLRTRLDAGQQDGFTLIELLIVIVVIGILAGIAILGVSQFQTDANTACTQANSRITDTVSAANAIKGSGSYTAPAAGACSTTG